nr:ribosomal RNA processing protein 36 homolog [Ipomoea batatas]
MEFSPFNAMEMIQILQKGINKRKNCQGKGKKVKTTITPSGEVVPYVPYVEGSGARFRGENLPTWAKRWDPKKKANYIAERNREIKNQRLRDEETEREKKKRRIEAKYDKAAKAIQDILAFYLKGTRNDLDEVLTTILFNVINENGLSLPNGMTANVLDAFTNYHNFKITVMYDRLMLPGDILGSRNKINEILRKAQEKAKEQQAMHGLKLKD